MKKIVGRSHRRRRTALARPRWSGKAAGRVGWSICGRRLPSLSTVPPESSIHAFPHARAGGREVWLTITVSVTEA